jgi:membrane-associated phospholipid phosphatase
MLRASPSRRKLARRTKIKTDQTLKHVITNKQAILIILLNAAIVAVTAASVRGAPNLGEQRNPDLIKDLAQNVKLVGTRPKTLEAVVLLAIAPSWFHHETNRLYRSWINRSSTDQIFEYGDFLGNGAVHVAGAVSLYFAGKVFHKPDWAVLGSDLTSGLLIAGTTSTGLKVATQRTRPDGAPYSFPSGHATMAFTTAGVIANRFGVIPGILAEAGALYVGLSRLQENKHYITDVVAGAALGNLIAYQVVTRRKHGEHLAISIEPFTRGVSTALVYRFK